MFKKLMSMVTMGAMLSTLLFPLFSVNARAASKIVDGVWEDQGGGSIWLDITLTDPIAVGDEIILTFPSEASVDGSGTLLNADLNGSVPQSRTNNTTDNTISIVADSAFSAGYIYIYFADALTSYTSSTYAQQSVAINHNDSSGNPVQYGVAIITNDNTTDVTATVPLFVNMSVDDVTMDLGTLSTASVSEVDQTYTINSNNESGVQVQIDGEANGLDDGAGNDIDDVSDGTVTAGSEEFGISVDNLSGLTADSPFDSGDDAIPATATDIASSTTEVSSATFDINYKASISGTTVAGSYDEVVTVTVATNA